MSNKEALVILQEMKTDYFRTIQRAPPDTPFECEIRRRYNAVMKAIEVLGLIENMSWES